VPVTGADVFPTRAVVVREQGAPSAVERIFVRTPGAGEVRVRVEAASLCHSDLSIARGVLTHRLPVVLGHEASGTIVQVGAGVEELAAGDRVVMLWNAPCGECWFCAQGEAHLCERAADRSQQPYAADESGTPIYPCLSTAAFAEETVLPARNVRRIPDDLPLDLAALLGCAVTTGVGAVRRTAAVREGQSVVVLGLGGVGLSAVQGARLAGADPIIAIDRVAEKLSLAEKLGATHTLLAGDEARREVRALTGGRGADHVLDCVGLAGTIRDGYGMARRGGTVTLVGIGGKTETVQFSAIELFYFARRIVPCVAGSLDPDRDLPSFIEWVRDGRLDLRALVSRETDLDGVEAGFADMAAGTVARVLVRPTPPPR